MHKIPDGFKLISSISPFADLIGPVYQKQTGSEIVFGLRASDKHCNSRGLLHGGVLSTLADFALGYTLAYAASPPTAMATASLTIDYAESAQNGDWIEVKTDVQKIGRNLAFANCYCFVDARRIARASAVFAVVAV